jgi:LruC domain-containing protein
MKKKHIYLTIILLGLSSGVFAQQLILNAESGNSAIEVGNCWRFLDYEQYTSSGSEVISGSYSLKTQMIPNSSNINDTYIKTPWMKVGSGNITFKARLGSGTDPISRGVRVSYIPYNASSPGTSFEGTLVTFYSYDFVVTNNSVVNFIVPIPVAIANSTSLYKIMVSYLGQGGNGRVLSDDYVFPGTYWSNPSNSCNPLPVNVPTDTDGDGVPDTQDEYPNDPYRSHNSYYPGLSQFGALAFEDNWPAKGDYDFNDLVVGYNFNTVTNGSGNVVELISTFMLRASGAIYNNGLAYQLDGIAPNKVSKVTGNIPGSFTMASNGAESGQTYANIVIFDNFFNIMSKPGVGIGINTERLAPYIMPQSKQVVTTFINNGVNPPGGTLTLAELNPALFNMYMIIKRERGKEVHLPNRYPSTLASTGLFGTKDDSSNPATGRYYKTANNLPWAVDIIQGFDYPIEKVSIDLGHLHFTEWAVSGGVQFPDWFMNLPGYRDASKIY